MYCQSILVSFIDSKNSFRLVKSSNVIYLFAIVIMVFILIITMKKFRPMRILRIHSSSINPATPLRNNERI